jgi:hypothetical protein
VRGKGLARWTLWQLMSPLRGFAFREAGFRGFTPTAKICYRYAVEGGEVEAVADVFDRAEVDAKNWKM